ncbi:MAG TPA: PQQ-binding-like beta-propeller repeat protein, partial [Acidobacteriaceae bacterium]|nr:PQQ-binding-like beta-propeller repeat protein [Acidobacteriaceae bacterium]
ARGWRRIVAMLRHGLLWAAVKLGLVSSRIFAPREELSPTQPFSSLPPLAPLTFTPAEVFGKDAAEKQYCQETLRTLVNEGIYTPVSEKNTLLYPGSVGGVNWGSPALDPLTGILYANTNRLAYITRLVRRPETRTLWNRLADAWGRWTAKMRPSAAGAARRFGTPDTAGQELSAQAGAPYLIFRAPFLSPSGLPCTPQPWGEMVALDLNSGKKLWAQPLGTMLTGAATGSPSLGGPIVTASGVIFSAATVESLLRAYDRRTGKELWRGELPGPAQATPMTFMLDGKQYVVICAGGHGSVGTEQGDAVVAFALD